MSHTKRLTMPVTWNVERKKTKFITTPKPGPHNKKLSMPLGVMLRDVMKISKTMRESKKLIFSGKVWVDGVPRKSHKFPIGLMDVLSFPEQKEHYRITLDEKGRLKPIPIKEKEKNIKICKIKNKTCLKKNRMQLNLDDGRNIILPDKKTSYATHSSVLIEVPSQKIKKHLPLKKDALVLVISGKHAGDVGKIQEIKEFKGTQKNRVLLKSILNKKEYETLVEYVLVVGEKTEEVTIK